MKLTGHLEKWASGILGVVCLVLLINLAQSSKPVRAGGTRAASSPASAVTPRNPAAPHPSAGEVSVDDPEVRLNLLKQIQSRPLLDFARNPFEFEPVRVNPSAVPSGPAAPVQPPPPPPLPLKALGYAEKKGNSREAYVSDDEQIYVVHVGETFGGRFKVLKITSQIIEIEDASTHQTAQVPFPQ